MLEHGGLVGIIFGSFIWDIEESYAKQSPSLLINIKFRSLLCTIKGKPFPDSGDCSRISHKRGPSFLKPPMCACFIYILMFGPA